MLQKKHRLTTSIGRSTTVVTTPFFVLKCRENNNAYSRFGFVISKKVAKSAVDRNRTKRVIRSAIEQSLENIKGGYDMLFIITKTFDESEDPRKAVIDILQKKNIWQNT
jgi:ribonuclease P protein component